jgi:hypothetical protein
MTANENDRLRELHIAVLGRLRDFADDGIDTEALEAAIAALAAPEGAAEASSAVALRDVEARIEMARTGAMRDVDKAPTPYKDGIVKGLGDASHIVTLAIQRLAGAPTEGAAPEGAKEVCGGPKDGRDCYPECDCDTERECKYGSQPAAPASGDGESLQAWAARVAVQFDGMGESYDAKMLRALAALSSPTGVDDAVKRRLLERAADYDNGGEFAQAKAIGIRSAIEEIETHAALAAQDGGA